MRIAASIAQGIALAADCPVARFPGSEVVIRSAQAAHPQLIDARWLAIIPSRGDSYYLSLYQANEASGLTLLRGDALVSSMPQWLHQELSRPQVIFAGGGLPSWLPAAGPLDSLGQVEPNAAALVEPARLAHAQGHSVLGELALPIYVGGDSPWQKSHERDPR